MAQPNQAGPGDSRGKIWQPGECDARLRNHDWFWHPNREASIYSLAELVEMYYRSVGRGYNLILNGNIGRDGLVLQWHERRFRSRAVDRRAAGRGPGIRRPGRGRRWSWRRLAKPLTGRAAESVTSQYPPKTALRITEDQELYDTRKRNDRSITCSWRRNSTRRFMNCVRELAISGPLSRSINSRYLIAVSD